MLVPWTLSLSTALRVSSPLLQVAAFAIASDCRGSTARVVGENCGASRQYASQVVRFIPQRSIGCEAQGIGRKELKLKLPLLD